MEEIEKVDESGAADTSTVPDNEKIEPTDREDIEEIKKEGAEEE